MPVTYGSTWAGAWNQKWGWNGIEQDLLEAKSAGAVPVVQWWYWGDDISPSCVENGCTDRYQGVPKDQATWTRLSNELADLIVRVGGADSPALVVIETEFNKNGIENYEPFDGYLAHVVAHRWGDAFGDPAVQGARGEYGPDRLPHVLAGGRWQVE